jgi:hypothetical protein
MLLCVNKFSFFKTDLAMTADHRMCHRDHRQQRVETLAAYELLSILSCETSLQAVDLVADFTDCCLGLSFDN